MAIDALKRDLIGRGEATELVGNEKMTASPRFWVPLSSPSVASISMPVLKSRHRICCIS